MAVSGKTKKELIEEIKALKSRVKELERSEAERMKVEQALKKTQDVPLEDVVCVSDINIEWKRDEGLCTFEKLPVAMMPSSFIHRSGNPMDFPRLGADVMGVQPSPSETMFFLFFTGRSSKYLHIEASRPTSSRLVRDSFTASRSYLANSGLPHFLQTVCIVSASCFSPQAEHSR